MRPSAVPSASRHLQLICKSSPRRQHVRLLPRRPDRSVGPQQLWPGQGAGECREEICLSSESQLISTLLLIFSTTTVGTRTPATATTPGRPPTPPTHLTTRRPIPPTTRPPLMPSAPTRPTRSSARGPRGHPQPPRNRRCWKPSREADRRLNRREWRGKKFAFWPYLCLSYEYQ